ncbi:hypothetical protein BT67DRAFT_385154, partial [Trichocladium antarcticum]
MDSDTRDARRSSIEKTPVAVAVAVAVADALDPPWSPDHGEPAVFARLPDEIIQQILEATDPNGFASLALLNTKWRSVAQQAHLYAHHLAHCPSYAHMGHSGSPTAAGGDDLPRLRRLFAREAKRNLFDAYTRPRQTIIKVISNSISSSSCPGGEGIQFSPSPKGHHLLAYNSSRIHVVDLRGAEIAVRREFKILRRPAATCINDAGTLLAVLLTEMQVDIYNLTETPPKRTHSMILDHSPRAIALSPCGSVLAAAYEGGIEVSSMSPGALSTDRRAVKCDAVDALTFSFDGTQILGTTVHSPQPTTVILTAPYYDPGSHMADDNISALWTTSILFPNTSRDCSHAVLIQNAKYEEAGWAFAYDRSFETFRAVLIDDLRNGTTYFTGPVPSTNSQARLIPSTLPAASYYGELVAAGFQGSEIWLYGVPEDLDAVPDTANTGADGGNASGLSRGPSVRSSIRIPENGDAARMPQWQILCDKFRNTFVAGCKISELEGVNTVKFVADFGDSCMKERLIVAARGVVPNLCVTDDEGIDFVDGGRITVLDFDYGVRNGAVKEYTIEVGSQEPEVLEEEHRDMATEVAIVRRRTVAQRRGSRSAAVMRSVTNANRAPPLPTQPSQPSAAPADGPDGPDDPLLPRRIGAPPIRRIDPPETADDTESVSFEEQEAMDAPYEHASPRSGTTLRRAATATANNRQLHPSAAAAGHIVYRRADGRAEHPHESDADNWVPPPPPYQKEDPCDLPSFLRHSAVPPLADPNTPSQPFDRQTARNSSASMHHQMRRAQPATSANRHSSPIPPSSAHGRGGGSGAQSLQEGPRPTSRSSRYLEGDNIYDVSPPDSPSMPPVAHVVSRGLGVGQPASSPAPPSHTNMASSVAPPVATEGGAHAAAVYSQSRPPARDLQIPNDNPPGGESLGRRLSVSRTWPIQPISIPSSPTPAGYPYSAPSVNFRETLSQSFPPLARAEQSPRFPNPRRAREMTSPVPPGEDMPLIISTPKGVSGAFDRPGHPSENRAETPILAPVPRHPRPSTQAAILRPPPDQQQQQQQQQQQAIYSSSAPASQFLQPNTHHLPAPPAPGSASSAGGFFFARRVPSLSRRASRAERSAAKNVADAKRRGWSGRATRTRTREFDAQSSAAWTDVSVFS